jgi:hypothetical protein
MMLMILNRAVSCLYGCRFLDMESWYLPKLVNVDRFTQVVYQQGKCWKLLLLCL